MADRINTQTEEEGRLNREAAQVLADRVNNLIKKNISYHGIPWVNT